ncbi:MAG: hypothetical protein R3B09_17445 [Nannocystaceae bacterium]
MGREGCQARASLAGQLAALGRIDDAESIVDALEVPEIQAFARGEVLGQRVTAGLPWALSGESVVADRIDFSPA